ncbi:ethylene-responsive transcription factor ERF [Forsythia ovata]|uniref:Ethylene-responsive transcription factor ERF n=1 Tax=Forsythia ovata TaxID=205694 RepID=A0ABD1T2U3_9LAMI
MVSAAYGVAVLALKESDHAVLNSPDRVSTYPLSALPLPSPPDIRQAAAATVALMKSVSSENAVVEPLGDGGSTNAQVDIASENEFTDEEALFDMPNLLVGMAEGMLVSTTKNDVSAVR